jgi:MGT family glycosyltransferase
MRALITCWPFTAHVHGQMAVAAELTRRGHEVAFYTGASAAPTIERAGYRHFPMVAVDEAAAARHVETLEMPRQSGRNNVRLLRAAYRNWLVETIPQQVTDLTSIVDEWSPDVIACDLSLWGPLLVLSDTGNVPVALSSTFLGPLTPGRDAPPAGLGLPSPRSALGRIACSVIQRITDIAATGMRRRIDQIRADYGLAPMGCSVNRYTGQLPLYLVPSIPELDYGRTDVPASVHYVGPLLWHPPSDPTTNAWLDTIPTEKPWVHVTESTLRAGDPFLLRAAVDGLAHAPLELIGTTGLHRDPASLGFADAPANIHLGQWVNHDELLPRCEVVITTGGPATITAALAAGVPLIIVPTTWDKPDNARRVVEAGVGIRLSPRKCTPDELRKAVMQLMQEPAYRKRAQELAAKLAAAPGADRAADLLEQLAAQPRRPEPQRPLAVAVPSARRASSKPGTGSQK